MCERCCCFFHFKRMETSFQKINWQKCMPLTLLNGSNWIEHQFSTFYCNQWVFPEHNDSIVANCRCLWAPVTTRNHSKFLDVYFHRCYFVKLLILCRLIKKTNVCGLKIWDFHTIFGPNFFLFGHVSVICNYSSVFLIVYLFVSIKEMKPSL